MVIENLIKQLIVLDWYRLLIKVFALICSGGYLIYSLIYYQQVIKMSRNTLIFYHWLDNLDNQTPEKKPTLVALAVLQIVFGVFLLLLSIFFL
jgi:hypothetical protein